MFAYILKRLLLFIPTLLGVLVVTFVVTQFVPGGPVEQYMAAARDTSPIYYQRYMIDYNNRPVDVEDAARDRIYWFFSLDYTARRQYSEDTATNVYYEQMATHWGNWAKLFFNNKGVAAHSTDVCMNYPPNDPTVWNW